MISRVKKHNDALITGNVCLIKKYLHLYKEYKISFSEKKGKILEEYKTASLKNRKMRVTDTNRHL